MNPGSIQIHLIAPAGIPLEVAMGYLIDEEKLRAARFHFARDAAHWAACRAALRQILAREIGTAPHEVPLVYSEFGKPALAAPFGRLHFNLSHCTDLAILALSESGPVGVDLESLERASDLLECVDSFCHPDEIARLPHESREKALQLLHLWTAKEAVLKALGTGMSHPPDSVRIRFETNHATARSEVPLDGIDRQVIHPLQHPKLSRHLAAVCARAGVEAITYVEGHVAPLAVYQR